MNKLKVSFVFLILLGFHCDLISQTDMNPREIRQIMQRIPDSLTFTTNNLANYIENNFYNEEDITGAIYYWIAENIFYDIEKRYDYRDYDFANVDLENILKSRLAICQGYSALYADLANKFDIKSYVVKGYTNKSGRVELNPHAWCATFIDSVWYLVEPTWGAGYWVDETFIKKVDFQYFKVKPKLFVKSHIPFDPMWQLLEYPISKKEFNWKMSNFESERKPLDYLACIAQYEKQSKIERMVSEIYRIESNGINNYLDYDNLYHKKFNIKYYYILQAEEKYNTAVGYFNDGIYKFNEFIEYKNNKFLPYKKDIEIRAMIEEIENLFNLSLEQLNKVENENEILENSLNQLKTNIYQAQADIIIQKERLNSYFETFKVYRENLAHPDSIE